MTRKELIAEIKRKRSLLCVGLDTDPGKIPQHLKNSQDPIFEFNKAIIDATHEFAVAYKPNLAFYEAEGVRGWQSLEKTLQYLNNYYPNLFTIADAKRGDIGNTAQKYARCFFQQLNFDSVTIAPYMGRDSVEPFLSFKGKWGILLGLTSNSGAEDFQLQTLDYDHQFLFEKVVQTSKDWGSCENLMYVVGATKSEYLKKIRSIIPEHFLLVPGVGAQGGNLQEVLENALGHEPNLLINSSRGIIYVSKGQNFAEVAREQAKALQMQMANYL